MKKLAFVVFVILNNFVYSQSVIVKGFVERKKTSDIILITINDTINKLGSKHDKLFSKVWNNKNLVLHFDNSGEFEIKAKLSDSLFFYSYQCESKKYKVSDLLKKDSIHVILEPEPCEIFTQCKEKNTEFYIFIGKKIKVESAPYINYCNVYLMDSENINEYKIIQNLYNKFPADTIVFSSFNHFSSVTFDEYENVILYVAKSCNKLYQLRNQYDPVYKTKSGEWISPSTEDYDLNQNKSEKIPHKIIMKEPIYVPNCYTYQKIEDIYIEPLYKIKRGKVFLQYGYTPKEILEIRKKFYQEYITLDTN